MGGNGGWFRNFMNRMATGLRSFMAGRYGTDQLNTAILLTGGSLHEALLLQIRQGTGHHTFIQADPFGQGVLGYARGGTDLLQQAGLPGPDAPGFQLPIAVLAATSGNLGQITKDF